MSPWRPIILIIISHDMSHLHDGLLSHAYVMLISWRKHHNIPPWTHIIPCIYHAILKVISSLSNNCCTGNSIHPVKSLMLVSNTCSCPIAMTLSCVSEISPTTLNLLWKLISTGKDHFIHVNLSNHDLLNSAFEIWHVNIYHIIAH